MKRTVLILMHWGKVFFVKSYFISKGIYYKCIKTRTSAYISVFVIFSIIYVSYYLDLVFTAPVKAEISSTQYSLFVSKIIKDFPIYKPVEKSKSFSFRLGQNEAGIRDAVTFKSFVSVTEIISYYQVYFDVIRYRPVLESQWTKSFIMYRNNLHVFYISVSDNDLYRTVAIERYIVDN